MIQVPNKCEGCGACCAHKGDDKWVEVTAHDALHIPDQFLQPGDIEPFAMRQTSDGRCICLGDDKRCLIYENRPAICRAVQRGDSICLTSLNARSL
jgi:Fe-S-cluster containining protein